MKKGHKQANIRIGIALATALLLFSLLFAVPFINFWLQMAVTVLFLCGLTYAMDRQGYSSMFKEAFAQPIMKTIILGLISAIILYFIFFIGNMAASWIKGGTEKIADVYTLKHDNPVWMITLIIALIVGPGEEFFWRGYIQRALSEKAGNLASLFITSGCYCIAHLATGNFMLLAAALVCGLFWGAMYWRYRNIYANMISHVAWDLMVFILIPFGQS